MRNELSGGKGYITDFDTRLTGNCARLFSYAKDAKEPIIFRHYNHSHIDAFTIFCSL